ncbi:MAG: threonine--tRNA ligase, partial [Nanoarchaeota archaeon]|nr:threonine--tRNA ligase [Nanoarchaeota archaeon]
DVLDLSRPIQKSGKFAVLTFKDVQGKEVFWHSSAHLLAMAVLDLWPETKLTIGPPIENGFYYDFQREHPFTPEDLEKIEKKMEEWREKKLPFERSVAPYNEAKKLLKHNTFKLEILEEYKDTELSFYSNGDFCDMCRGPHVPHTGYLTAFKLTKVSAAYWRGDASKESLQRIYGISYPDKKELKQYLELIEEAKKRDHRKLGSELQLFAFNDISPGSAFFLPKGALVFNALTDFIRKEYRKRGYKEVVTPLIYDKSLWEQSGHWAHYKENMFLLMMDGREASLKPMNCPSHCLIYKMHAHSYKDLPLRIADFAMLHRNEAKGALGGLTRVRKFSQDDAHIFIAPEQMQEELSRAIEFTRFVYEDVFKFTFETNLSTRPKEKMGTDEQWDKAEDALKKALDNAKLKYTLNAGDGAFYGPKIDFRIKDALNREWQLATVQLDFQLPERFGLEYMGEDGKAHRPVMIHRALLGSLERFIGILVEHFAGRFPLWLAPVQVKVVTVADTFVPYAKKVVAELEKHDFLVELDDRSESIPKKVRDAQLEQVPVIITIGEKEQQNDTVAPRTLDGKIKFGMKLEECVEWLNKNREKKETSISVG